MLLHIKTCLYFNLSLPELMRLKFEGFPEGVNLGEYLEKAVQDDTQPFDEAQALPYDVATCGCEYAGCRQVPL